MKSRIGKTIWLVLICLLSSELVFAEDGPQLINVQGILNNSSGDPVSNGSYSVLFRIYNTAAGGSIMWGETRTVTTTNGLFTVELGEVVPFEVSVFNDTALWLGIKVESDPEMTPRQRLTAVPYSMHTIIASTERNYVVSGPDFSPITNSIDYEISVVMDGKIKGTTPGQVVTFFAPVHLPEGATITEFRAYVYDNDATQDITVTFFHAQGTIDTDLTTVSSTGTSTGWYNVTDNTLSHTVENLSRSYIVKATWTVPATAGNNVLGNINIEYTVSSLNP